MTKPAPQGRRHAASASPSPGIFDQKPWLKDVIACVLILFSIIIMFPQMVIEGKAFSKGDDTESAASMVEYAREEAEVREYPMWCPYIFGGFPGLAAGAYSNYEEMGAPYSFAYKYTSPRWWADQVSIRVLFLGGFSSPLGSSARWYLVLFLYGGLLTYLLLRRIDFSPIIAFMGSMLIAWNPYLISLATAAHGGKMMTFIYMPLILLLAYRVMEKRRILDAALLAVAFGWQIAVGGHTQVLFYSVVAVGLLYLTWLFFDLRENKSPSALLPGVYIVLAFLLGFGTGALWYIPLMEFVGHSIRGIAPAFAEGAQPGYSMADATMWSFHPQELLTLIVPSWFGLQSPYYWGTMPFTSSSFYFGVVPLLFAVLAFFGKKDRLFWGLLVIAVFSFLLSMGSHFQSFYSLFFNFLPFFNKFRTPSLIMLLFVMSAVVFAAYGIRFVLSLGEDEKWKKRFLICTLVCAALLVLFLVAGDALAGMFGSFAKAGEERQYKPEQIQQLYQIRVDMFRKDAMLAAFFLTLGFGACWLHLSRKLKATGFALILVLITVVDLWRFSHQFFEPQPASTTLAGLRPNAVTEYLRQDKSVFRVMPLGRIMQDNRWGAWEIASLGGYHGAKLRSYQDLLDYVAFKGADPRLPINLPFFNAMNCKYFIAEGLLPPESGFEQVAQDQNEKWVLYKNPNAMSRVYFVDSVEVISDRKAALTRLAEPGFKWRNSAILTESLPGQIKVDSLRSAEITEYVPHAVSIKAKCSAPSLLVLSDAFYEPGWSVRVNGQPSKIFQVNNFVRGVYLQPGEHEVVYEYTGKYEKRGVTVATVSHFLTWGLVLSCWFFLRRRRAMA